MSTLAQKKRYRYVSHLGVNWFPSHKSGIWEALLMAQERLSLMLNQVEEKAEEHSGNYRIMLGDMELSRQIRVQCFEFWSQLSKCIRIMNLKPGSWQDKLPIRYRSLWSAVWERFRKYIGEAPWQTKIYGGEQDHRLIKKWRREDGGG